MNDKTPPYEIDPADVRVGDLIEVTSTEHPDSKIIDRVTKKAGMIHCTWSAWTGEPDGKTTFRLLDRPEPPKPALPTESGSVVLIAGEAWVRNATGRWWSLDSTRCFTQVKMAGKDWTLAKVVPADDPTAPVTVLEVTEDNFEANPCGETCPGRGYGCTRPVGHDGLHVATAGHGVCAYWGEVQP